MGPFSGLLMLASLGCVLSTIPARISDLTPPSPGIAAYLAICIASVAMFDSAARSRLQTLLVAAAVCSAGLLLRVVDGFGSPVAFLFAFAIVFAFAKGTASWHPVQRTALVVPLCVPFVALLLVARTGWLDTQAVDSTVRRIPQGALSRVEVTDKGGIMRTTAEQEALENIRTALSTTRIHYDVRPGRKHEITIVLHRNDGVPATAMKAREGWHGHPEGLWFSLPQGDYSNRALGGVLKNHGLLP